MARANRSPKLKNFETKTPGNGELVVQHGELRVLFPGRPRKNMVVQKTAIFFGP